NVERLPPSLFPIAFEETIAPTGMASSWLDVVRTSRGNSNSTTHCQFACFVGKKLESSLHSLMTRPLMRGGRFPDDSSLSWEKANIAHRRHAPTSFLGPGRPTTPRFSRHTSGFLSLWTYLLWAPSG